ncbi:MAG: hypothetical protein WAW41_10005, partial [Methylobacter sp.]
DQREIFGLGGARQQGNRPGNTEPRNIHDHHPQQHKLKAGIYCFHPDTVQQGNSFLVSSNRTIMRFMEHGMLI